MQTKQKSVAIKSKQFAAIKLQSLAKMWLVRRKYLDFKDRLSKVTLL